jgi:hypothetical protein
VFESALDAFHQLADGFRLVAGGLERSVKFEVHRISVEEFRAQVISRTRARWVHALFLLYNTSGRVLALEVPAGRKE